MRRTALTTADKDALTHLIAARTGSRSIRHVTVDRYAQT